MKRGISVVALVCVTVLAGCATNINLPVLGGKQSEEGRVAAVLNDVHHAMQTHKAKRVISHISKNYTDADGRDYDAICDYVSHILSSYRDIEITRVEPPIEIDGDTARALEAFGTLATPDNPDEAPPVNMQGQVLVTLQKEEGTWKIISWGTLR